MKKLHIFFIFFYNQTTSIDLICNPYVSDLLPLLASWFYRALLMTNVNTGSFHLDDATNKQRHSVRNKGFHRVTEMEQIPKPRDGGPQADMELEPSQTTTMTCS